MEANCRRRIMSDGVVIMGRVDYGVEQCWKILRSFWEKLTKIGKKRSEGLFFTRKEIGR